MKTQTSIALRSRDWLVSGVIYVKNLAQNCCQMNTTNPDPLRDPVPKRHRGSAQRHGSIASGTFDRQPDRMERDETT